MAVPEVREAYGRFPCDRHRDRSDLELMFGDTVDFSLCDAKVAGSTVTRSRIHDPCHGNNFEKRDENNLHV